MHATLNELKQKVETMFTQSGETQSAIKGLSIFRRTEALQNQYCLYRPMAVLVLQGEKQSILGTDKCVYKEGQLVVTSIDIPSVGCVIKASPDKPFISIVMDLDSSIIEQFLSDGVFVPTKTSQRAMGVIDASPELTDAFYRLICLLETPERQKVMAPMILKEIHYLLLTSSLGDVLCSVNAAGSQNNQIVRAIDWLKENYRHAFKIDELAQKVNMTEATFYRHFNQVTSLSPLQYQKKLRLYEAHRLMMSGKVNVEKAAYEVGYESSSQFNREYKRMFGVPPKANVKRIKQSILK